MRNIILILLFCFLSLVVFPSCTSIQDSQVSSETSNDVNTEFGDFDIL